MRLRGIPILRKTIEAYLPVFPTPIVVVRADDELNDAVAPSCKLLRIDDAHLGMSRSLVAGVEEAHDTPWILVGLSDMPFVKSATLSLIKWVMDQGSYGIVRPRYEKKSVIRLHLRALTTMYCEISKAIVVRVISYRKIVTKFIT